MSNIDWVEIKSKLPVGKSDAELSERSKLFAAFDPNNNGYLSLAEVDKGCNDVLGLGDVFYNAKKVIMRSFQAAKAVSKVESRYGPDYIERSEFRLLLVYLRQYLELWEIFKVVDAGDSDHRISFDEFEEAIPKLKRMGISISNPKDEFKSLDTNDGGYVLFDEFVNWAIDKNLDLETDEE